MTTHDPLEDVQRWYDDAVAAGISQPEAMALATSAGGRPSVRMVLLRGISAAGIRFFTNRESRKGHELEENPHAAVVLHWEPLGRQLRLEGRIELLPDAESDEYFRNRPRGHQLGAWASPQSLPITPEALAARAAEAERRFAGRVVPRPPYWGGYRLVPDRIEFWTQRDNRLHERVCWSRVSDGWRREILAP